MKPLLQSTALVLTFTIANVAHADAVTDWNQLTLDAIRAQNLGANNAARAVAIEALAVHDAVASIGGHSETYLPPVSWSGEADPTAAAIAAAAGALLGLFPAQASTIAEARAASLDAIPESAAKSTGIEVGERAAAALLAERTGDGSSATGTFPGGIAPGEWRPTPPGFLAAAQPYWVDVTPFVLEREDQFRPEPPPALDSAVYAKAFKEVKALGDVESVVRSDDETQIAQFWVPASTIQWNDIARGVALDRELSLEENARLFALLNAALADSRVAAWDAKYTYGFWRPVTSIPLADTDGNPHTVADLDWTPLLVTPNHPDYPSGHSTSGAAAAEVLRRFFGDQATFTIGSDALPGVTRSYASFSEAAAENGRSRIYGGIHYAFADRAGQRTGHRVGAYTFKHLLRPRVRTSTPH